MQKYTLYTLTACLWLGSIFTLQAQNKDATIKYATIRGFATKTDPKTNKLHSVLLNVKLTAGTTQQLDMVYATGVNYSFIPAHTATALHAKNVGEIDLAQKDPEVPKHLGLYNMNQTGQTKFQMVQVDKFDLGVGPAGGSVTVLVLDDKNSDFGIIGLNWPLKGSKKESYTYFANTAKYPKGALYYGPLPTQTMKQAH